MHNVQKRQSAQPLKKEISHKRYGEDYTAFVLTILRDKRYNVLYVLRRDDKMSYLKKDPKFIQDQPSKLRGYAKQGLSAFLVILLGIITYFVFLRFDTLVSIIGMIFSALSPIIYGLVFAFLMNPIVKKVEKFVRPAVKKIVKKEEHIQSASRVFGIIVALVVFITVIVALFNMIIPELYRSVSDLVATLPGQLKEWVAFVNDMIKKDTTVGNIINTILVKSSEALQNWVQTDLVSWAQNDLLVKTNDIITGVTSGVMSIVNVLKNVLVGLIISFYVLLSKEKFACQGKKLLYAMLKPRNANNIMHITKKADTIFTGFIIGKIIDSAIIGAICFVVLSILRMPYALLVTVIVGVTNIIPFFGPFIGGIPSAILIFLVDPLQGLYFVIFIILLQQLDGNVIGPKILGDSTGLSSFWVIFSILVFSGLFGFAGMIIGVPTFALLYYVVKMYIQERLEQKQLPIDTEKYIETNYVDNNGIFVSEKIEEQKEEEKTDADSSTE